MQTLFNYLSRGSLRPFHFHHAQMRLTLVYLSSLVRLVQDSVACNTAGNADVIVLLILVVLIMCGT